MIRTSPVELPEGYIDFYKNLETWQTEQQIKLQKTYTYNEVDDVLSLISEHKKPLLIIENFSVDTEQYRTLLHDLLEFLINSRPELKETLEKLNPYIEVLNYNQLIHALLKENYDSFLDLADKTNIPPELLIFIFDHAVRPFFRLYAAPYAKIIIDDTFQHWEFPTICPICGSKAHISRLRSTDNRRFMFCDRCFSEWEIKYLKCVHCGNDEPGTIKYISIENDDAYQIYTCEECKGYLKTYNERQGGRSVDLFIANIETIYLDMLAVEKGYTNHEV